jgi:hypothetical protein
MRPEQAVARDQEAGNLDCAAEYLELIGQPIMANHIRAKGRVRESRCAFLARHLCDYWLYLDNRLPDPDAVQLGMESIIAKEQAKALDQLRIATRLTLEKTEKLIAGKNDRARAQAQQLYFRSTGHYPKRKIRIPKSS